MSNRIKLWRSGLVAAVALTAFTGATLGAKNAAAPDEKAGAKLVEVKISGKEVSILPELTEALGNFEKEGIDAELIGKDDYDGPDYLIQKALNNGQIDISVHWFQHVIYGEAHKQPTKAVMLLNDAPGVTVMVANRVKDKVRSAADFRGLKIAEGGGYGTKSMVVNLLATRAGLPLGTYTPMFTFVEGRLDATMKALADGDVDVIAFREPMAGTIQASGQVSTLYELSNRRNTTATFGAPMAAQSVLTSNEYLTAHPDRVQHVVNAFTRTMRFINSHTAEEIIARLPKSHFKSDEQRNEEIRSLRRSLGSYAKGDYSFTPAMAKLQITMIDNAPFDDGEEGQYRRKGKRQNLAPTSLYTNVFVAKAMKAIRP